MLNIDGTAFNLKLSLGVFHTFCGMGQEERDWPSVLDFKGECGGGNSFQVNKLERGIQRDIDDQPRATEVANKEFLLLPLILISLESC